ncbi:unnamed protein product [Arabidopsis halleri]
MFNTVISLSYSKTFEENLKMKEQHHLDNGNDKAWIKIKMCFTKHINMKKS